MRMCAILAVPMTDSPWFPLAIIAVTIVLGIASAVGLIHSLRYQLYRRWSWPLRWAFLAVAGAVVLMGAFLLIGTYVQRWGWATALWLLAAPLAYGIWQGWPTARPPEPPPSTPASP
jgi:hypothetical protein